MKKLLSLIAVAFIAIAASAQTVLWQSEDETGVLVGWGNPCFKMSADEVKAQVGMGDSFIVTVSGQGESGWPQIAFFPEAGGWPPLGNAGIGGKTFPYVVEFPITAAEWSTISTEGVSFAGDGAYISKVELKKGEVEIGVNTVWFGNKKCDWGDAVGVPASVFANVKAGDVLKVWTSEASCQIILGGWSGLNLGVYSAGGIDNMTYEDGVATVTMVDGYAETNTYDGKDLNVFELMKANGVVIQGPTTITRIDYIPAEEPIFVATNGEVIIEQDYNDYGYINIAEAKEGVKVEVYEDNIIVRSWAGTEGYDLKIYIDQEGAVSNFSTIVNGVEEQGEDYYGYIPVKANANDVYYLLPSYCSAGHILEGNYGLAFVQGFAANFEDLVYYYITWGDWSYTLNDLWYIEDNEDGIVKDITVSVDGAKVTYSNGGVAFMEDKTGAAMVDLQYVEGLEQGTTISGKFTAEYYTGEFCLAPYSFEGCEFGTTDVTFGKAIESVDELEATDIFRLVTIDNPPVEILNNLLLGEDYEFPADIKKATGIFFGDVILPRSAADIITTTTGVKDATFKKVAQGEIFNLAGQKVDAQYKGIVIKNGKKVLVK